MTNKDVVIEIHLAMQRDGTIGLSRKHSEPIAASKAVELGMLDAAKQMILNEFLPGATHD